MRALTLALSTLMALQTIAAPVPAPKVEFNVRAPISAVADVLRNRQEISSPSIFDTLSHSNAIPAKAQSRFDLFRVMRIASREFPTVLAAQKEVDASREARKGAAWDRFAISGGVNKSVSTHTPGVGNGTSNDSTTPWVSLGLSIGVSQWFQDRGLKLTTELKMAQNRALQTQVALEAAKSYFEYVNESSRLYLLRQIKISLLMLLSDVDRGAIVLSEVNQTNLELKLQLLQTAIDESLNKLNIARVDVRKYTEEDLPESDAIFNGAVAQAVPRASVAGETPEWRLVDWRALEEQFKVPGTANEAFAIAEKAPALVIPGINLKMQEISWYLAASSMGPTLAISLNKSWNENVSYGNATNASDESVNVGLSFRLGGGLDGQLSSAQLLEESARLSVQAVKLQIKTDIEKSYLNLQASKKSILRAEKTLRMNTEALLRANDSVSDANLENILQLYGRFEESTNALIVQLGIYNLGRIGLLASIGTLLEDIRPVPGKKPASRRTP